MDGCLYNSYNNVVARVTLAAIIKLLSQANTASPIPSKVDYGNGKEGKNMKPLGPRKMKSTSWRELVLFSSIKISLQKGRWKVIISSV